MARKSLALLDAALARDPNYADAYVAKADAHMSLGTNYPTSPADKERHVAQAEAAARRAVALAPKLGSAYAMLAFIDQSRQDFAGSLRHMSQALALSPEDPNVLAVAPRILPWIGDGQEALRLADRLIALDPLNGVAYRRKSEVLLVLRRYPQSIEAGRRALELAPNAFSAHSWIGQSLALLGQHAEARAEFQRMPADDGFRLKGEAIVAARTGDSAAAKRTMARLKQLMGAAYSYQYGGNLCAARRQGPRLCRIRQCDRGEGFGAHLSEEGPLHRPDPQRSAICGLAQAVELPLRLAANGSFPPIPAISRSLISTHCRH